MKFFSILSVASLAAAAAVPAVVPNVESLDNFPPAEYFKENDLSPNMHKLIPRLSEGIITRQIGLQAIGPHGQASEAAQKAFALSKQMQSDSVCTHLHVGRFGWCAGCQRLERCAGYGLFFVGAIMTEIAVVISTGFVTPASYAAIVGILATAGFDASAWNYCVIGLCACQSGKCNLGHDNGK